MSKSKNLTISVKPDEWTLSSTNPIFVNIGGKVRRMDSELSIAKAPGHNWFNVERRWYEKLPVIGTWIYRKRNPGFEIFYSIVDGKLVRSECVNGKLQNT